MVILVMILVVIIMQKLIIMLMVCDDIDNVEGGSCSDDVDCDNAMLMMIINDIYVSDDGNDD